MDICIVGFKESHFNEVFIYWAVSSLMAFFVSLSRTTDDKAGTSMFFAEENKHVTTNTVGKGDL